jgi:Fe-S-cluster containining protein
MDFDFSPYFKRYEALLKTADEAFEKVRLDYPECVTCEMYCSDCCHAIFDLYLIEAIYINYFYNRLKSKEEKAFILEKANTADRSVHKLKKRAYQDVKKGRDESDILMDMAQQRVRCPLLSEEKKCVLYEHRPITCRFYGIPTSIGGRGHTCGLSHFEKGREYPTVKLDLVHQRLLDISSDLVRDMGSKYSGMSNMLVPVSMAVLTVYDGEYLGIDTDEENQPKE